MFFTCEPCSVLPTFTESVKPTALHFSRRHASPVAIVAFLGGDGLVREHVIAPGWDEPRRAL